MASIGRRMGYNIETPTETEFKKVNLFGYQYDGACRQIHICHIIDNGACIFCVILELNYCHSLFWVINLWLECRFLVIFIISSLPLIYNGLNCANFHRRLYAGIVIIVNYILMMTWLPATVIIVEEMNMKLCKCWQSYVDAINIIIERFGNWMQIAIIRLVGKFKYLFVVIFRK